MLSSPRRVCTPRSPCGPSRRGCATPTSPGSRFTVDISSRSPPRCRAREGSGASIWCTRAGRSVPSSTRSSAATSRSTSTKPGQRSMLQRLVQFLRPGGLLFLGHSESLLGLQAASSTSPIPFTETGRVTLTGRPPHDPSPGRHDSHRPDSRRQGTHRDQRRRGIVHRRLPVRSGSAAGGDESLSSPDALNGDRPAEPRDSAFTPWSCSSGHAKERWDRRRLQAKVFGGGHVLAFSAQTDSVPPRTSDSSSSSSRPNAFSCSAGPGGISAEARPFLHGHRAAYVKRLGRRTIRQTSMEETTHLSTLQRTPRSAA